MQKATNTRSKMFVIKVKGNVGMGKQWVWYIWISMHNIIAAIKGC